MFSVCIGCLRRSSGRTSLAAGPPPVRAPSWTHSADCLLRYGMYPGPGQLCALCERAEEPPTGVTEAIAGGGSVSLFSHTLLLICPLRPPLPPSLLTLRGKVLSFFWASHYPWLLSSYINPTPADWVPRVFLGFFLLRWSGATASPGCRLSNRVCL